MNSSRQLRNLETRIDECLTSVLDFLSRIQQGIGEGNWRYAQDKAQELRSAADRLDRVLDMAVQERRTAYRPRAAWVVAAIATFARHYRAGRALYPVSRSQDGSPDQELREANDISTTPSLSLAEAERIAVIPCAQATSDPSQSEKATKPASDDGPATGGPA